MKRPLLFLLLLTTTSTFAQIQITLRKSFIDSLKNKITITTDYTIDIAHKTPNPVSKDADMHIAGRSEDVGLPMVAEIMNAAGQPQALKFVHSVEGKDQKTPLTGVWRLWCEHAGEDIQDQGEEIPKITTTNPPHVFEVHPITKLGTFDLLPTLHPIGDKFTYKKADDALFRYAATRCTLVPDGDNVMIQTNGIGFNYVECKIELLDNPVIEDDGRFIFCRITSLDDEVVAQKVRIGFVLNSPPEKKVKTLAVGKTMHIIAIPRIDLALVSFRLKNADNPKFPNILSWNLPFELIAVAVMPN
jgi:hypothetical protein